MNDEEEDLRKQVAEFGSIYESIKWPHNRLYVPPNGWTEIAPLAFLIWSISKLVRVIDRIIDRGSWKYITEPHLVMLALLK
ncbi:MAG TPA: hypothetical protein VE863_11315 [Pyrinomonadaceae bacterium]|nr:hypothetical protein [Pyrinomonadaceae bacterium]